MSTYRISRYRPIAECPPELWELVAVTKKTEPKQKTEPKPSGRQMSYRGRRASLEALVQRMMDAEPGTRHDVLISVGTSAAKHHGIPGMRAVRMAAETTGLDDTEIERTLADAAAYAEMDDPVMAAEDAMNDHREVDDESE